MVELRLAGFKRKKLEKYYNSLNNFKLNKKNL
jgi:hypothetical protein